MSYLDLQSELMVSSYLTLWLSHLAAGQEHCCRSFIDA